jgi:hypothetical protein
MQAVKTIGLDIAKSGFQVHGVDADGQVVFRRQLLKRPARHRHHWSRELQATNEARRHFLEERQDVATSFFCRLTWGSRKPAASTAPYAQASPLERADRPSARQLPA